MYPDVIVEPHGTDEWIAMGREAAVAGETLILDIVMLDTGEGELRHRLPVCVIDSRPIILDGDMRHWIRLHGNGRAGSCPNSKSGAAEPLESSRVM